MFDSIQSTIRFNSRFISIQFLDVQFEQDCVGITSITFPIYLLDDIAGMLYRVTIVIYNYTKSITTLPIQKKDVACSIELFAHDQQ